MTRKRQNFQEIDTRSGRRSPVFFLLLVVPRASSPVTRVLRSLLFATKVRNEAPEEEAGFPPKGWFPLLRKFYVPTGVNFTGFARLNKIRDDVWTAYVNVKSWNFQRNNGNQP